MLANWDHSKRIIAKQTYRFIVGDQIGVRLQVVLHSGHEELDNFSGC